MRNFIAACALAIGVGTAAEAVTIQNGSFENASSNIGSFQTYFAGDTGLTGWTIESGSIDKSNSLWTSSDGLRSLDMNGLTRGTISQLVSGFTIGNSYSLLFDMSPNLGILGSVTLQATVGAASQAFTMAKAGATAANMGWQTQQLDFVAGASDLLLRFESVAPAGPAGAVLDNVRIESVSAVPVPAPVFLLMGAMGLLMLRRKPLA